MLNRPTFSGEFVSAVTGFVETKSGTGHYTTEILTGPFTARVNKKLETVLEEMSPHELSGTVPVTIVKSPTHAETAKVTPTRQIIDRYDPTGW